LAWLAFGTPPVERGAAGTPEVDIAGVRTEHRRFANCDFLTVEVEFQRDFRVVRLRAAHDNRRVMPGLAVDSFARKPSTLAAIPCGAVEHIAVQIQVDARSRAAFLVEHVWLGFWFLGRRWRLRLFCGAGFEPQCDGAVVVGGAGVDVRASADHHAVVFAVQFEHGAPLRVIHPRAAGQKADVPRARCVRDEMVIDLVPGR